jgi:two-component system sensor histidine kinase YesM
MIKGDIPQEVFQSIISDAAASKGTTTLLYNSQGEIIAHNGSPDLCDVSFINTLVDENAIPTTGKLSEVDINNNSYFIGRTKIDLTDWSLVYLINSDEVLSASDAYQKQMFWMVLALFLASIPLSLYTTKTVTNRIRKLQDHIEASREKGFDIEALENGTDEIGQLTVCYDDMASNLHILLEEQFQLGYQIKNLEFKVLQATIDPHFLYNSLDLMSWKALQNQDKDSANLAKALSRFYKLSLGHGQTMVLLSQELEHVRTYVEIQNMRFDGKINLQIEVPEQLQRLAVFKIMLQPIVENAIIHGIRERSDEKGTIRIKARTKIDMLIISISDNGVGMTSETIESILLSSSDEHSGYGVWNINERIRLAHGDDYGLRFYSKLGVGTVVFVKLPIFPTQSPLC